MPYRRKKLTFAISSPNEFLFTNRIVNTWNSLPNDVVHAESTNTFKSRLDKFWSNQEIIYDYRAEIQETGSRSVIY